MALTLCRPMLADAQLFTVRRDAKFAHICSDMTKMDISSQSGSQPLSGHVRHEGLMLRMRYWSDMNVVRSRTMANNNMRARFVIRL